MSLMYLKINLKYTFKEYFITAKVPNTLMFTTMYSILALLFKFLVKIRKNLKFMNLEHLRFPRPETKERNNKVNTQSGI